MYQGPTGGERSLGGQHLGSVSSPPPMYVVDERSFFGFLVICKYSLFSSAGERSAAVAFPHCSGAACRFDPGMLRPNRRTGAGRACACVRRSAR